MIRFLTPMRGAAAHDVAARQTMLAAAPSVLRLGGELILLEDDYTKKDVIVANLKQFSFPVISVHVPFPQIDGDHTAFDPRTEAGLEKMRVTAEIAQEIGAGIVVVHSQLAYLLRDWKSEQSTNTWRDALYEEIFASIKKLQNEFPGIRFCLENMPLPLFADTVDNADDMRFNPCLVTFQDLLAATQAGIDVTFDICHYDMMRRLWNYLITRDGKIDPKLIAIRDQIVGIYEHGVQPDYLTVVKNLGAGLGHIHLADSTGLWQNKASMPVGGLALNAGEQNQQELSELLHHLESNPDKEYSINLEVQDKDFTEIRETTQSLAFLAELLYGK